jgi:hypothetical protein
MPEHHTDYDDLIRHWLYQCWGLLADDGQHATLQRDVRGTDNFHVLV